jgi:hypothetical protein
MVIGSALATLGVVFDSHRPLHKSAKFTLIRLPLLTSHPSICAQIGGGFAPILRPSFKRVAGAEWQCSVFAGDT